MQAVIAGKGPDAALFVPEQLVANLMVRGALADMREMDGFAEREKEFYPSAFVAYRFGDGIYAMPETQNYNMLFYRTDILQDEGLRPPSTWDDFYAVLQKLQQKQLQAGIPESQAVFEMLLMQNGGAVYNEALTATRLTEQAAVDAFTQWTEFYIKHSLPLTFDFFNRFRTGRCLSASPPTRHITSSPPRHRKSPACGPCAGAGRAEGRTDYPHAEQHHEWRRYHRGGRAEGERLSVCELVDIRGRPSRFRAAERGASRRVRPVQHGQPGGLRPAWLDVPGRRKP